MESVVTFTITRYIFINMNKIVENVSLKHMSILITFTDMIHLYLFRACLMLAKASKKSEEYYRPGARWLERSHLVNV